MGNNLNPIDRLGILADLVQFYDLYLLLKDASNNEVMRELEKQDNTYFERILKNQEEILRLLRERK